MISLKAIEDQIWIFTTTAQNMQDQADGGLLVSKELVSLYRASASTFRQCAASLERMVTEEIATEAHDYLERS